MEARARRGSLVIIWLYDTVGGGEKNGARIVNRLGYLDWNDMKTRAGLGGVLGMVGRRGL